MDLLKLFRKKKKNSFPEAKHIILPAFMSGGVQYYQFDDIFNQPYERALKAIVFYQEVRMNCDRSFIEAHQVAINNILTSAKIDIYKIKKLNDHLGQRLLLPPDTELLYKLASVVFFDDTENPETYEFDYNRKKIDLWKASDDVKTFFLRAPIVQLMPFLTHVEDNIAAYHGMMQEVNDIHLRSLSANLSEEQKTALNIKKEFSPAATPQS